MSNIKLLITRWWIKFKAYNFNYQIESSHPRFEEIKTLLKDGNVRQAVILYKNPGKGKDKKVKKAIRKTKIVGDSVQVGKKVLPPGFSHLYEKNIGKPGTDSLYLLLNNFAQNPTQVSLDTFANFLENNEVAITSRGTLLLYKRVSPDMKDLYTCKVDNSPGQTVFMKRTKVTFNPFSHCSPGLHCCGYRYLSQYGHYGDPVILIEVDPRDVVSVPNDHGSSKIRVCRYYVWGRQEEFGDGRLHTDILGKMRYYDIENLAKDHHARHDWRGTPKGWSYSAGM